MQVGGNVLTVETMNQNPGHVPGVIAFPQADGFSLAIARDLAGFSAVAYEPSIHGAGITVLEVPELSLRAVIAPYDDHTEIAIRGTVNLEDWILDLDVRKEPLDYALPNGVLVHAGFLKSAKALLPQIFVELGSRGLAKPIYVTGHSLGGAVASVIAYFLRREGYQVAAVYTFASPRVGNAKWRKVYTKALGDVSYRVIAAGDLVPLLPGLLDGYRHVGQEILLTEHGIFARPPHWWEIMQDSWRVLNAVGRGNAAPIVKLHSINRDYLPLLT